MPVRLSTPALPSIVSSPEPPLIVSVRLALEPTMLSLLVPPVTLTRAVVSAAPLKVSVSVVRPAALTFNRSAASSIVACTSVSACAVAVPCSVNTSSNVPLTTVPSSMFDNIASETVILSAPLALIVDKPSTCAFVIVNDWALASAVPATFVVNSSVSMLVIVSSEKFTAVVPPATTMRSVLSPPSIVSPAPVASAAALSYTKLSSPSLPVRLSTPALPSIVSSPEPPEMLSSTKPPTMLSLPMLPRMVLFPCEPMMVSAPDEPLIVKASVWSAKLTVRPDVVSVTSSMLAICALLMSLKLAPICNKSRVV